ncbi:MAG: tRNA pseudouridine(55) synthase TruB [Candidatus Abyssubacteria bacterium]
MTSHDVVAAIRKLVRPLRVGHTGTLDPLATGLLILCVGRATKVAQFIEARFKTYRATMLLGVRTDTQDITGEILTQYRVEEISEERIREVAHSFLGVVEQKPPMFSAVKVGGVRAYKLARNQKSVSIAPRKVEIRRLEIEQIELPRVEFLLECSKGTYVRVLCQDLGEALGVGGCMESLRRIAIGDVDITMARPLSELNTSEVVWKAMLPVTEALSHMPAFVCTEEQLTKLVHGTPFPVRLSAAAGPCYEGWAQAHGHHGELLAVGVVSQDGDVTMFHPKRVLEE